jgi:hypothetical protein
MQENLMYARLLEKYDLCGNDAALTMSEDSSNIDLILQDTFHFADASVTTYPPKSESGIKDIKKLKCQEVIPLDDEQELSETANLNGNSTKF